MAIENATPEAITASEAARLKRNAYMRAWSAKRRARTCKCEPCQVARAGYLAKKKQHRHTTAAHRAAYKKAWRAANRARVRDYDRAYYTTHKEQARAYSRDYRARTYRAPLTTAWPFTRRPEHLDPMTAAINAAIPRSLPPHIREEIAQDLAVEMLTTGSEITPAAVAEAVRAYWRRYPVMAGRERSLDAPRWSSDGDSRERWIDTLSA